MNWQEILTIIIPLGAFMAWIYNRIDRKIDEVKFEIKDLRRDIQSLDSRVSHIEGQLLRMYPYEPRWEPKVLDKTEAQKQ